MARKTKTHPLVLAARRLRDVVGGLSAPVGKAEYVLNPLDYAWPLHQRYVERFAPREAGVVEAVLVGMNPGPWGMAQTGVPFGSPDLVREFLGVTGKLRSAPDTHAKRPIVGVDSTRGEVSGRRLWGGVRDCFGTPEAFFARFFVLNYCPLVFQSETGANVTPDKLPQAEVAECFAACDRHLGEALEVLGPRTAIGVGKWAEKRLKAVVADRGLDARVASILHPSPASPIANRGWLPQARKQLAALGHPWPEPASG